jgi:effector-binding domain-containing protein
MKVIKQLGILFLVVIAIALILVLVLPVKQKTERSITINAPVIEVYNYLLRLENFNKWSVWSRNDSTIKNTISGTDGTPGAVNTWVGDPALSGEGKMQIISLTLNKKIKYHLNFETPRQMEADSDFSLEEINGQTKVTWDFELATPRPSNIFNLFSSMDKEMGKDFEKGLQNLKTAIEKTGSAVPAKTYEVTPMNFPASSFALYRETIKWESISSFFAVYFPKIYEALSKAGVQPGIPTGLYYEWDEKNQQADMAAAIPVAAGTIFDSDSIKIVDINGSKAVYVDYYGAYDKTADAYKTIDAYLLTNKLKQKSPVIEQYMNDPGVVKDTAKWLTKIIFLVE